MSTEYFLQPEDINKIYIKVWSCIQKSCFCFNDFLLTSGLNWGAESSKPSKEWELQCRNAHGQRNPPKTENYFILNCICPKYLEGHKTGHECPQQWY